MVSFKKGNGCPVACEQGRASSPIMAGRSVSFPMWLSRDFSQRSCPANPFARDAYQPILSPFLVWNARRYQTIFLQQGHVFRLFLQQQPCNHARWMKTKTHFELFICLYRTKIILSLMKLRHLNGHLQRRAYYFLKSSTWFSGFRKFCRQLGPTAVEWYNGLHCTRKTAERDRSRVTKVVYQTF